MFRSLEQKVSEPPPGAPHTPISNTVNMDDDFASVDSDSASEQGFDMDSDISVDDCESPVPSRSARPNLTQ